MLPGGIAFAPRWRTGERVTWDTEPAPEAPAAEAGGCEDCGGPFLELQDAVETSPGEYSHAIVQVCLSRLTEQRDSARQEVERLRVELAEADLRYANREFETAGLTDERDAARAELARLRAREGELLREGYDIARDLLTIVESDDGSECTPVCDWEDADRALEGRIAALARGAAEGER